jgi:hypothetical protein
MVLAAAQPVRADGPALLFSPVDRRTIGEGGIEEASLFLRERLVQLDKSLLFKSTPVDEGSQGLGDSVRFNFFDDVVLDIKPLKQETVNKGRTRIWIGRINGQDYSEAVLAVTGDNVAGNIRTPSGEIFQIRQVSGPIHQVRQVDGSQYPQELPPQPWPPEGRNLAGAESTAASQARTGTDDGSVLDVMVLYTPSVRQAVGGTANTLNLIHLAVAETNQGYANSQVIQRLRLVHTYEVDYIEETGSAGFYAALSHVTGTSDKKMDEIHALRDQYGADLVSLWINNGVYCGLGYLMTSTAGDFSDHAFTICDYTCATGYYSFAHEMGHNQGCHHNREVNDGSGVYSYSHGYQQTGANPPFRTIMAYNCSSGCTRLNYWSNPEVSVAGFPTGIVSTAPNSADNHLSLNNTRNIAANWRQSVPPAKQLYLPWLMLLE